MRFINSFQKNTSGAFSVIGVLTFSLALSFFGALFDYSVMLKRKVALQTSVDTTVVWLVNHYSSLKKNKMSIDERVIERLAYQYFLTNFRLRNYESIDYQMSLPSNQNRFVYMQVRIYFPLGFFGSFYSFLFESINKEYSIASSARADLIESNKLELALVLDVSGSFGTQKNPDRINIMKDIALEFVDVMRAKFKNRFQVSIVPFDTFVNVRNKDNDKNFYTWLDHEGRSPKHWAHFDFLDDQDEQDNVITTGVVTLHPSDPERRFKKEVLSSNPDLVGKGVSLSIKKDGSSWGKEQGEQISRFDIYSNMKILKNNTSNSSGIEWGGCVEAPLYPYNIKDAYDPSNPETFFVPSFYPDNAIDTSKNGIIDYWPDMPVLKLLQPLVKDFYIPNKRYLFVNGFKLMRLKQLKAPKEEISPVPIWSELNSHNLLKNDARKYFFSNSWEHLKGLNVTFDPYDSGIRTKKLIGPNFLCNRFPIVPLKKPFLVKDHQKIRDSINSLYYTNNPGNLVEGLAWGWRTLSHKEPFTEGAPDDRKDVTKMIVLITDGKNDFLTLPKISEPSYDLYHKYQNSFDHMYTYLYARMSNHYIAKHHVHYNAYGYGYYGISQLEHSSFKRSKEGRRSFEVKYNLKYIGNDKEMNNQTFEVCQEIKKAGIQIIILGLGVDSIMDYRDSLLKSCASPMFNKIGEPFNKSLNMYWNAEKLSFNVNSFNKEYLKKLVLEISKMVPSFEIQ